MPTTTQPHERVEPTDEPTPLPEDAETVIWAQENDSFRLNNPDEYDDALPDGLDYDDNSTVHFHPGEELPLPIARDVYAAVSHFLIVLDSDGDEIHAGDHAQPAALSMYNAR